MAPKRKEDAAEEVPSKAAKVEEETKDAEMKEEDKEKEKDDAKDSRPAIKEQIGFDNADATLNVISTHNGRALMCMSDNGMQFLIAGARANVGMKAGRYFYEVKVIEALSHWVPQGYSNVTRETPQLVRLGFSTAGSSLVLGEDEDGVCVDNHGMYTSFPTAGGAQKRTKCQGCVFGVHETIGVLLNLDAKSSNANTISLFRNGIRLSEPQALPDHLKGQVLFPHVAFRNVTVHVSFGKQSMASLPFKCRMLQDAAQADVKDGKLPVPKNGKYDVVYPVGFPDEGTFEWLDCWLKNNPQYTELSDRAILDWCNKSGITKDRKWRENTGSNDRPMFNFGTNMLNDGSIKKAVYAAAPHFARHYVVMEVKENLCPEDRAHSLKRFNLPHFKRIAHVVMGDPKGEYVAKTHEKLLARKQKELDDDFRRRKNELEKRKAEKKKKKEILERQKKLAEENRLRREAAEKKRAELQEKRRLEAEAKKAKEEEAKKKEEEEVKKKEEGAAEGEEKKEDVEMKTEDAPKADVEMKEEEKKEEEVKKDEVKEEVKKEEVKEEVKKEEEKKEEEEPESEEETMETEPPKAELTAEDKKTKFVVPTGQKDLTDAVLNMSFGGFSVPSKDEGFDEVKYEWDDEAKSRGYVKKWVLNRKVTARVDTIVPGEAFNTEFAEFNKAVDEYQAKQKAYNMNKPAKAAKKKEDDDEEDGENKDEDKKDGEEEPKKEEADIFSVSDVCDIGDGEPLFAHFVFEDWMMFQLRYECYLLTAHFMKDVNDPERVGIHQANFAHYYNRYFKRQFAPRAYGKDSLEEVLALIQDAVEINASNGVVQCKLEEDKAKSLSELFKLQEENRRERQRRIDAGDESVRVSFDVLRQQLDQQAARGAQKLLSPTTEAGAGANAGPAKWIPGKRAEGGPQPAAWESNRAGGPVQFNRGGGKGNWMQGQAMGQKQWEYAPRR